MLANEKLIKNLFYIISYAGRWLRRNQRSLRSSVSQTSSTFSTQTLNLFMLHLATELRWDYCTHSTDNQLAACFRLWCWLWMCDFRMCIPTRRWVFLWTGFSLSIPKGSWYRSMPKPVSPRKPYSLILLIFMHILWLWTHVYTDVSSFGLCVSFSVSGVCARWLTMSSLSLLKMREQTSLARRSLTRAAIGAKNCLVAPFKKKKSYSLLRRTEKIPSN